MLSKNQKRTVKITINLPMEFPDEWDDELINFYLNDSSWCFDNLLPLLEEYSEKHGCICGICKGEVL